MENFDKREMGFIRTLLEILKFSCILGSSIVMTTILYGIMKHSTGATYYASFALLILTIISIFSYTYDKSLGQREA